MLGSPKSSGYPVFPICSFFAPGHPGASPPSVYSYIELRTLESLIFAERLVNYWS